jgi:tetratricopeptide (TPR) repeat protein
VKQLSRSFLLVLVFAAPAWGRQGLPTRVIDPCRTPPDVKAPEPSEAARRAMEAKLAEARAAFEKNPRDVDAVIWLGRRLAYLGRFDEAVDVYTEGVRKHPRDARLYRHRGHRFLTMRCTDEAVKDLEEAARLVAGRADEVEPDGLPNARGVPTSTLKTNIYYHLGLAHYLRGDFERARAAYRECLKFSKNPDMVAATAHWLYMTLRRLRREAEAREVLALVRDDAEVIENHDYQRLVLMYKGRVAPESLLAEAARDKSALGFAGVAYGVGHWHLAEGRTGRAVQIFLEIMDGPQQTSFGFIAAEAELRRLGLRHPRALTRQTLN